eukprot:12989605-Alexandrium_andersonii.AAC.1
MRWVRICVRANALTRAPRQLNARPPKVHPSWDRGWKPPGPTQGGRGVGEQGGLRAERGPTGR